MCPHKEVEQSKGHHIVIPCQVGETFIPFKVFIPHVPRLKGEIPDHDTYKEQQQQQNSSFPF